MKTQNLILIVGIILALSSLYGNWEGYLPTYVVHTLYEDGDYLWLGTTGGIIHYNIHTEEKTYYNTLNTGLHTVKITALTKDQQGNLWVASTFDNYRVTGYDFDFEAPTLQREYWAGLYKFATDGAWHFYNFENTPLEFDVIHALAVDNDNKLWIGTIHYGIFVHDLNDGSWTNYTKENADIGSNHIRSFYVRDNGEVWVGHWPDEILEPRYITEDRDPGEILEPMQDRFDKQYKWEELVSDGGGISRYHNGVWTNFFDQLPKEHPESSTVHDITEDANGILWFAATLDGFLSYDGYEFEQYLLPYEPYFEMSGMPFGIDFDHDGNIWLGTNIGIYTYDGDELIRYHSGNGLNHEYAITIIHTDSFNNVWMGSDFKGLFKYHNGTITEAEIDSEIACYPIRSIEVDASGRLWIGAGENVLNMGTGGLYSFDGDQWDFYGWDLIDTWRVNDIFTRDGYIYLATGENGDEGGAAVYDGTSWTIHNFSTSDYVLWAGHSITACENRIWVGVDDTNGGLSRYENGQWTLYTSANSGLATNNVTTVAVDPLDNSVWVGSRFGLYNFDGSNWTYYFSFMYPELTYDYINDLYFDDQNTLWVAMEMGLASYDGEVWQNYDHLLPYFDGWGTAPVWSVTKDEYDRVWIAFFGGVMMLDLDNNEVETFDMANSPLPTNFIPQVRSDRNGKLWIRTWSDGLYAYEYGQHLSVPDDIVADNQLRAYNYPNPFNPTTSIVFDNPHPSNISLDIYNVRGQKVKTLLDREYLGKGVLNVIWDGSDSRGNSVSSGIYFYTISDDEGRYRIINKMMMIK